MEFFMELHFSDWMFYRKAGCSMRAGLAFSLSFSLSSAPIAAFFAFPPISRLAPFYLALSILCKPVKSNPYFIPLRLSSSVRLSLSDRIFGLPCVLDIMRSNTHLRQSHSHPSGVIFVKYRHCGDAPNRGHRRYIICRWEKIFQKKKPIESFNEMDLK